MATAGRSRPGSDEALNTGKTSEEEEEAYVEHHIGVVMDFMGHLKKRGNALPPKAKDQYKDLKVWLQNLMGPEQHTGEDDNHAETRNRNTSQQDPRSNSDAEVSETSQGSRKDRGVTEDNNRKRKPPEARGIHFEQQVKTETTSPSDSGSSRLSARTRTSRTRRRCREDRREDYREPGVTEHMMQRMIAGVDTRSVPDQAPFDERSGEDLSRYLAKFENYCNSRYKGSRDLWIGELERHLTGKTLEGFKALRDAQDTYERAKAKLLEWHSRSARERKEEHRREFKKTQYQRQDGIYLHGVRLERMFRTAYPDRDVETSRRLRDKFMQTMPENVGRMCRQHVTDKQAQGQMVTWTQLQTYAKECDKCLREDKATEGAGEEEIVIHLGQETKSQPRKPARWSDRSFYKAESRGNAGGGQRKGTRYDPPAWNQSDHKREFTRPYFESTGGRQTQIQKCFHCGRLGHIARECRRRLGQCFGCGGKGHLVRNCSQSRGYRRSQSVPPNRRPYSQKDRRVRSNSRAPAHNSQGTPDERPILPRPLNDPALL